MKLITLSALLDLVESEPRLSGAQRLAKRVGATHLCVFLRDPDLPLFLPAPGFPQTLPEGFAWQEFLAQAEQGGEVSTTLVSPYTLRPTLVSALKVSDDIMGVLFGNHVVVQAHEAMHSVFLLSGALYLQESRAALSETRALLARRTALESRKAVNSLSDVHEQLSSSLHKTQYLMNELRLEQERLNLAGRIFGLGAWEASHLARTLNLTAQAATILGLRSEARQIGVDALLASIQIEDRDAVAKNFETMLLTKGEYSFRFRISMPDGARRWIENRSMLVESASGDPPTILGFSLDVTNQVMSEQVLIRSEKLAAAGRLAASIAHEINNPLEGLINILYLAQKASVSEEVQGLLSMAENELARLAGVARQTLSFYRDQQHPTSFCLVDTIQQIVEWINRDHAGAVEFEIHPTRLASMRPEVLGWPGEIRQAITNLLLNAIQASAGSRAVKLRLCPGREAHRLLISDHGAGIPSENYGHIFDPFFTTRKDSGTGLGLWITRQITERHGGKIYLRSQCSANRHGTLFRITLPDANYAPNSLHTQNIGDLWQTIGSA